MTSQADDEKPKRLGARSFLDRVESLVFSAVPCVDDRRRRRLVFAQRVTFAAMSGLFIALFIYAGNYYPSTRQRIEANPLVTNLTKAGQTARVAFGRSPDCGGNECWTQPDFDDASWIEARLPLDPNTNIKALRGYAAGLATGTIYYRIKLRIPENLANLKDEISFTPVYVSHRQYEIYVNGRLTTVSNGVNQGWTANISIPKRDIRDGSVLIVIKGSVTEGDIGIAHFASALLGPKYLLDDISVHVERANFTYYLLFLLTKGSIFTVFTLFFCFTRGQRGLVNFLVFAFFVTFENLFGAEFLANFMPLKFRAVIFFLCKAFAVAGLLGFFINFYHAPRLRRPARVVSLVVIALVAALTANTAWLAKSVTFSDLYFTTNTFLVSTIVFAIALGILNSRKWRRRKASGRQLVMMDRFTIFLGVYLSLIIWEFYFKAFGGFDKRAMFDVAFFIWLALTTAMDMGLQENTIKTLEGHMEEKHRMEVELQEAAEIARAFFPETIPSWRHCAISTFHRPLTENSGDWYAFEQSPSGRLCHFILCDITGHGVQAAIVVSTCKSILNSIVHTRPELLEETDFLLRFMRILNTTLYKNGNGYHVSTLLGVTFEPEARQLHYVSAGHPSPLLVAADGKGRPKALISRHNVLGIKPQFEGALKSHPFVEGDHLIAYTDGLPVGSNVKALRTFLAESVTSVPVAQSAPAELYKKVWEAETGRTSHKPNDDVSIVWFSAVA